MTNELRVLVIDDSENDAVLIARELQRANRASVCRRVQDEATARTALESDDWDVVLCDSSMPNFGARAARALLTEKGLEIPLILVSGGCDESTASGIGARDLVRKDELSRLVPTIERHLAGARDLGAQSGWGLAGSNRELLRVRQQLSEQEPWVALGRSSASIAHDLNNALSVILTRASPFMNDGQSAALWRENREEIENAARRAAGLTHRILAFGRGDFSASQLLNVNSLLRELEGTLQCLAGNRVKLTLEPSASFSWIRADSRQIERIVVGLVVHARRAMPHGGCLTIATSNPSHGDDFADDRTGASTGQTVTLRVSNTGAGIDEVTRSRLFEPAFGEEDPTETTNELHTVADLVRRSRGTVRVESEPGAGTTFFVHLPSIEAAVATSDRPPVRKDVPLARDGETVLLVEDDDRVRAAAGLVLRRCGYRVLEAQNAGEALLIGKRTASRIDLLITDLVLPRVGGIELAEELQSSRPEMRILFISGSTEDASIHGVHGTGLPFVQKPLTPELLATKVRQELDRTADTIPPP
ncbi:MAG TPA: response regulator [Polyangiaceae bacterium]|nr:response regulator [Polyangiaceae bacterium]